jgi:hypothetical protein
LQFRRAVFDPPDNYSARSRSDARERCYGGRERRKVERRGIEDLSGIVCAPDVGSAFRPVVNTRSFFYGTTLDDVTYGQPIVLPGAA